MTKLLLEQKKHRDKANNEPEDGGENPLAAYDFFSPAKRARRREKISLMRGGGHGRR